ncbi:hypothetical protein EDD18DRAFT_797586 [Armillaria luteobubalina]|uniref:Uncharacterized protein n=1 Tax=Armillaria luteobubalina TaxID=153913 RepID=A0AA39TD65_9AGAR|nr:hypothetical protein EDD18DRAFT_797586 [Armillaria luteobubalina]
MRLNRDKVEDEEEETMELINHSRMRNRSSLSKSEMDPLSAATPTPPPMAKSILLGGTPMGMVGMLLGAGIIAGIHHFFLAFLQGHDAQEQFWIKNSSNAFSTLVQWLCTGSVTISLTQLIWLFLCRRPFTIKQLNHLFGLPDPIQTLCLVWSWKIFPIMVVTILVQALAFVSILAPNALEVGSASPTTSIISVPTISFANGDGWTTGSMTTCTYTVTTAWERILSRSFQSDTLIGWNAPAGCGSACNYTIEYAAPALQCSDIGQDEILDDSDSSSGPSNPSAILWSMNGTTDTAVYNATSVIGDSGWNFTMTWRTYHGPSEDIAVAGVQCALFNATQRAVVSFVNNTAIISPSVISFNDPFSISDHNSDCAAIENGSTPPVGFSSRASYIVIMAWLCDQLDGQIGFTSVGDKQWFSDTNVLTSNLFSMNETAKTFSPNPPDMRRALEETLINATIALISSEGDTAMVETSVARDQLIWVYHALRLWIPYAVALVCTAVCGAAGLTCIVKNKEVGDLGFSAITRATRNEDLDDVFGAGVDDDENEDAVLQYGQQRKDGRGRFRVFDLAK